MQWQAGILRSRMDIYDSIGLSKEDFDSADMHLLQ